MKTPKKSVSASKAKIPSGPKLSASRRGSKVGQPRGARRGRTHPSELGVDGYSAQAKRFIERSRSVFNAGSDFAATGAKSLLKAANRLEMPDQREMMAYAEHRPLVVGAVGLGIGAVIGMMIPRMAHGEAPRRRK